MTPEYTILEGSQALLSVAQVQTGVLSAKTLCTFMREFSPFGLRQGRAKEETQTEESLWPNMCSPPEFLVHLRPSVYLDVTVCPASNGDAGDMWCFANSRVCHYMIDRCRGSPALQKFFTDVFEGVLITDYWAPYESVCAEDRQYCPVHLLRELQKVDLRNDSAEWQAFTKKLGRLLGDGMRFCIQPMLRSQTLCLRAESVFV